jgi:hypothetical protein
VRQPRSGSRRSAQEAYWTYEDIGAFLLVAIALSAVVRLAVLVHLLDSSELLVPGAALQTLITAFVIMALYGILKLHYRRPVVAPLGWLIPSRFYTVIAILGGVAAAFAITYLTRWRGHVMPAIAGKEFLFWGCSWVQSWKSRCSAAACFRCWRALWEMPYLSSLSPFCLPPFMLRAMSHIGYGLPLPVQHMVRCAWRRRRPREPRSYMRHAI